VEDLSLEEALRYAAQSFDLDLDEAIRLAGLDPALHWEGDASSVEISDNNNDTDSIDSELKHLPAFQELLFEELIEVERQILTPYARSKLVYMQGCDKAAKELWHKSDPYAVAPGRDFHDLDSAELSSTCVKVIRMNRCDEESSCRIDPSEGAELDDRLVIRRNTDLMPSQRTEGNALSSNLPCRLLYRPSDSLVLACDMLASQVYIQLSGTSMMTRVSLIWPHWLQEQLHLRQCTAKYLQDPLSF
jgi:hypothetical protein